MSVAEDGGGARAETMGDRKRGTLVAMLGSAVLGGAGFRASTLSADGDPVTLADIESRLRSATASARKAVGESKQNLLAAGVVSGVAVIAGAYLHGRRRGRRRATVLEIRRA